VFFLGGGGGKTGDLINKQNKRVDMDARNHTLPPMDHTPNQKQILDLKSRVFEQMFEDCPYKYLLIQTHTWEEKVVRILHVVRCREFTQRNPKTGICQPCRFSLFNIALFDFDKE